MTTSGRFSRVVTASIMSLTLGPAAANSAELRNPLPELRQQLASLQTQITDLATSQDQLRAQITDLTVAQGETEARINEITIAQQDLTNQIVALQQQLVALQSQVDALAMRPQSGITKLFAGDLLIGYALPYSEPNHPLVYEPISGYYLPLEVSNSGVNGGLITIPVSLIYFDQPGCTGNATAAVRGYADTRNALVQGRNDAYGATTFYRTIGAPAGIFRSQSLKDIVGTCIPSDLGSDSRPLALLEPVAYPLPYALPVAVPSMEAFRVSYEVP